MLIARSPAENPIASSVYELCWNFALGIGAWGRGRRLIGSMLASWGRMNEYENDGGK